MAESIQHKLDRVRKPRVQITYDVHIGDATEKKELPFIVGVLGDFTGDPTVELEPMENRKFIQIDRVNFNDVMARLGPGLNLRVENTLQNDGTELSVQLKFKSMDDFTPAAVANQVEPLKKLLEARDRLVDLRNNADRKKGLEAALEDVLKDADKRNALASEMGGAKGAETKKEGDS
jgi:type VI secretion system protein ImpB